MDLPVNTNQLMRLFPRFDAIRLAYVHALEPRLCCKPLLNNYRLPARLLLPLAVALNLAACQPEEKPVPPTTSSGELVVLIRNSSTSFLDDESSDHAGFEHDLVELFAKDVGLRVKFIAGRQFNQILPDLVKHKAHLAAAGLSITPQREQTVRFGPPYQNVQQRVMYNVRDSKPKSVADLVGRRIEVVAGSTYAEQLKEARQKFPALTWREATTVDSDVLLEKLAMGAIDITVVDSNVYDIAQNFYVNIKPAFDLGKPEQVAWAFPKDGEPYLFDKAQEFFKRIRKDGTLARLIERYYGHVDRLEAADVVGIMTKRRTVLPKYRPLFQQAQELTGIDWRLLAAVGYQESHWDPLATSPTNVRGLMMLTEDTADLMGVSDRLDPTQNIPAASRYFLSMKDTLPERISEPDRTWLALASYNAGYGHVEDARVLAQRQKLNPDSWADLKRVLPLLTKPEFNSTVKHGYARGGESVIFVENIRTYYDILARFEQPHTAIFSLSGRAAPEKAKVKKVGLKKRRRPKPEKPIDASPIEAERPIQQESESLP
jgi:membrane-bound lytic murein transglycosylase F